MEMLLPLLLMIALAVLVFYGGYKAIIRIIRYMNDVHTIAEHMREEKKN